MFSQSTSSQVNESSATSLGFGPFVPNENGLPGATTAISMLSGVVYYALLLVMVGLVLSAGLWAVGAFSNSHNQTVNGKRGFLVCGVCALAIGGAYNLTKWFFNAGQNLS